MAQARAGSTERRAAGPIDSHCHLQSLSAEACVRSLEKAREAGVSGFLVPAIRLEDSDRLLELSHRERDVWCALGVHPHEASSWSAGHERRLEALLREPRVVAVGECGLDFHYDLAPRNRQIAVMRAQWELAVELDLPVIVHNRDSNDAMREVLAGPEFGDVTGVFHSFAGGKEFGQDLLTRDFSIGVSGMVTFPRAENIREVLPLLWPNRLLVETDTPYLAPVPHRGQPNQPAWVVEVAQRVARDLGLGTAEVSAQTTANFFSLFPKALASA